MSGKPTSADPRAQLRDYWGRRATREGDDCARIESSRRSQRMRFEMFRRAHALDGTSILDVGCGVGDLWDHLQRGGVRCRYLGVDLSPEMAARAAERFPGATFEVRDILEWQPPSTFDYVVSFAVHNVRVPGGADLLDRMLRRQFELCGRAAHISLLTDRYDAFDAHIQPWRVEDVLSLALSITPYVALRHDYLPHDFSVSLYRQPLIDVDPTLRLAD